MLTDIVGAFTCPFTGMMGDEVYSLSEYPLVPIVKMQHNDFDVPQNESSINLSPDEAPHQSTTAHDGTHEQICFGNAVPPMATRLPADIR